MFYVPKRPCSTGVCFVSMEFVLRMNLRLSDICAQRQHSHAVVKKKKKERKKEEEEEEEEEEKEKKKKKRKQKRKEKKYVQYIPREITAVLPSNSHTY